MRTLLCHVSLLAVPIALLALPAPRALSQADDPAAAKAANAAGDADVPVKQVVLFSSGVGYFEHFGTVRGDGSTELRFQTEQINDVLKSLVLQDLDGGRAGTISYPSQEPIDKALKSFRVDITANPGLEELLNQLRGARLIVNTVDGPTTGIIVGVQKRTRPVPPDAPAGTSPGESWLLNLKVGRAIRAIPMDDVRDFTLEDPKLDAELEQALSALAQSRDQEKKPVTIGFRGEGERRVRIGYVVETPIWKTSYRLILDAPPGGKAGAKKGEAPAGPRGGGNLQGWAIVENQTDGDWNDVQLSLVSGRPISFIQHLYRPLYARRPVVWPELFASLRPQTYKGGITAEEFERMRRQAGGEERDEGMGGADAPDFSLEEVSAGRAGRGGRFGGQGGGGGGSGAGGGNLFGGQGGDGDEMGEIDPAASVIAAASAGQLGELFEYTVGNVTLPRQRSAMIPIVTDAVEVERVSIYNSRVLPNHPLRGARLKNTTGKHLLQGPVTVLDAGAYAGDARIDDVPPGQERLLSFGIDLQVLVQREEPEAGATLQSARLVNGVLELERKEVYAQTYVAQNKSDADKMLVLEVPSVGEDYVLVEPKVADETTQDLFRFRRPVPAGGGLRFKVVMEADALDIVHIDRAPLDELGVHVEAEEIPPDVRKALAEAVAMRRALDDLMRDVSERESEIAKTTADQARIRENMKSVSDDTEYYTRLLKKLDEQESAIEATQKEIRDRLGQQADPRAKLTRYLSNLNVG